VCAETIPRGQTFGLTRGVISISLHLECYLFWLHACGLLDREPVTCASCRRLIPPHAETVMARSGAFHARCHERMKDPEPATAIVS
jgi:hypothetical protein